MIGIVVLNYRGAPKSLRLIEDLRACFRANIPAQVYLVDNASNDESPQIFTTVASKYDWVKVILNPCNDGYGKGNNIGINAALEDGCHVIVVLNPDVRIEQDFLVQCQHVVSGLPPKVGIVSPRILEPTGTVHADVGILNVATGAFTPAVKPSGRLNRTEYPLGCALVIQPEFAQAVAGHVFREDLFLYGEEFFLKMDAERAGYLCWSSSTVTVVHEGMESSEYESISDRFRRRLADRNLLWYVRERYGAMGPFFQAWLSLWVLIRATARATVHRDWAPIPAAAGAVYGAWAARRPAEGASS